MKKAFLSLLLSFAFFSGVVSAQTEDPFRGMSGYVLSTNVDWGVVRFGLNKFDRVFTNTTWLSNAEDFTVGQQWQTV